MAWVIAGELWDIMQMGEIGTDMAATEWSAAGRGIINNPKGVAAATGVIGGIPSGVMAGISSLGGKSKDKMASRMHPYRRASQRRRINTGDTNHPLPIPIINGGITETRDQGTQTTSQMEGHGADAEVNVAPVPRAISKIHPDHFNIRLPYVYQGSLAGTNMTYSNQTPACLIRLNSIYDVMTSTHEQKNYPVHYDGSQTQGSAGTQIAFSTVADDLANPIANVGTYTSTPALNVDQGPQGRNIWQAHFKYYRVLRSDVKITFLNRFCDQVSQSYTGTEEASTISSTPNQNCFRNAYAIGFELIDEDGAICNNAQMFLMTKNAERAILPGADMADISFSTGANAFCIPSNTKSHVMQYTYNPETWEYHVEQQGVESRWTAVGSNPSLHHQLAVRFFHLDSAGQNYPSYTNLGFMVQIEYEVQFMECLDSFYKTQYYQASASG